MPGSLGRWSVVAAFVVLAWSGSAAAQDTTAEIGDYPIAYQERPLVLDAMTVAIDAGFSIIHADFGDFLGADSDETFVTMAVGGSFGITDDLEVGATVIPLELSPDFEYLNPTLGATYRFVRGAVEVGGGLAFVLPVQEDSDFQLVPRIPVLIRGGNIVRVDTGLALGFTFADSAITTLTIPVFVAFQATPSFFLGPRSNLVASAGGEDPVDFNFGDTAASSLGLLAGYTIAGQGDRPIVDLLFSFDVPLFFSWGEIYEDTITTDVWAFGFGARVFLDAGGGPTTESAPVGTAPL